MNDPLTPRAVILPAFHDVLGFSELQPWLDGESFDRGLDLPSLVAPLPAGMRRVTWSMCETSILLVGTDGPSLPGATQPPEVPRQHVSRSGQVATP